MKNTPKNVSKYCSDENNYFTFAPALVLLSVGEEKTKKLEKVIVELKKVFTFAAL